MALFSLVFSGDPDDNNNDDLGLSHDNAVLLLWLVVVVVPVFHRCGFPSMMVDVV